MGAGGPRPALPILRKGSKRSVPQAPPLPLCGEGPGVPTCDVLPSPPTLSLPHEGGREPPSPSASHLASALDPAQVRHAGTDRPDAVQKVQPVPPHDRVVAVLVFRGPPSASSASPPPCGEGLGVGGTRPVSARPRVSPRSGSGLPRRSRSPGYGAAGSAGSAARSGCRCSPAPP
jgi:hypothetical protein